MKGTDAALKSGKKLLGALEKYKFVLLVLLAGVLLLLLPPFGEGQAGSKAGGTDPPQDLAFDLEGLEQKLAGTLSEVEGAGKVSVVLTVKASTRQVLAQDSSVSQQGEGTSQKSSTTVVVSKGSGQQEAVPLQQIYPQFQGALVVCHGGDDPAVQLQLVEAVSALTGLGADKVTILKGN